MAEQVELERVGEVPPDARVRDYDELDEPVKHRLADAVGSAGSGEDQPVVELDGCDWDVVKFTEYYQLGCI